MEKRYIVINHGVGSSLYWLNHILSIFAPSKSYLVLMKICVQFQALATSASCLISLSSGLTYGISSTMLPELRDDKTVQYEAGHESWIGKETASIHKTSTEGFYFSYSVS